MQKDPPVSGQLRLDTLATRQTPEGVMLELRAAGTIARAFSWLLDLFCRLALGFLGLMAFAIFQNAGQGLFLMLLFALTWLYPVLFEVLWNGQTPGKKAMGLMVVHDNGTPVGWYASMVRNLMRVVDALPFAYGFGMITAFSHRENKRIGDLVAGTLVIYTTPPLAAVQAPYANPSAPPRPLKASERAAVIGYAERYALLSQQRQLELADVLSPFLQTEQAGAGHAVRRLLQIANFYLGREAESDVAAPHASLQAHYSGNSPPPEAPRYFPADFQPPASLPAIGTHPLASQAMPPPLPAESDAPGTERAP